jgi:hypothetical protein
MEFGLKEIGHEELIEELRNQFLKAGEPSCAVISIVE